MKRLLAIALLLITAALDADAGDVRVVIAPRSLVVPRSGTMLFDVYWVNSGSRAAAIPGAGSYITRYAQLAAPSESRHAIITGSHPPADRKIGPRAIVRDVATVDIEPGTPGLLEVGIRFRGQRGEFDSNSAVVRSRR